MPDDAVRGADGHRSLLHFESHVHVFACILDREVGVASEDRTSRFDHAEPEVVTARSPERIVEVVDGAFQNGALVFEWTSIIPRLDSGDVALDQLVVADVQASQHVFLFGQTDGNTESRGQQLRLDLNKDGENLCQRHLAVTDRAGTGQDNVSRSTAIICRACQQPFVDGDLEAIKLLGNLIRLTEIAVEGEADDRSVNVALVLLGSNEIERCWRSIREDMSPPDQVCLRNRQSGSRRTPVDEGKTRSLTDEIVRRHIDPFKPLITRH